MKKVFFLLAFMLTGVFVFANTGEVSKNTEKEKQTELSIKVTEHSSLLLKVGEVFVEKSCKITHNGTTVECNDCDCAELLRILLGMPQTPPGDDGW